MPFGGIHTPSLALSLLSAELGQGGISTAVHYLNLAFAERIGVKRYDRYSEDLSGVFLGEWLFSDCLFPQPPEAGERFVEEVLIPRRLFTLDEIESFERDRAISGAFLEDCLRAEDWTRYRIIGFTTTFQQNTPSLAFARMIKRLDPKITIVFGGANCEGSMGVQLRRSFPWIDFVCTGEGDDVFPELARQILGRAPWTPLPGIIDTRDVPPLPARMVTDIDRLPIPDFSAYFDRLDGSAIEPGFIARLPIETSRGCWWGEKHHCTFCGLNGATMRFRSKSPARALDEITQLANQYRERLDPACSISLTDNILDMRYLTTLLPALRDAGLGVSLFYETKANLTREQVRMLADAGVREIQPGIESLHTALLRLMRKGCTALQNIQLLRWCREFGVIPHWNLLCGFPGEDPLWFEQQIQTVRSIPHLTPPNGVCMVRLDRFSPYYVDPDLHGIARIRAARPMSYIYALPADEIDGLAYHFDFDFADGQAPENYIAPLSDAVCEWRETGNDRFFLAFRSGASLILWDGRRADPGDVHVLSGGREKLYEHCDRVRGRTEAIAYAQAEAGLTEREAGRLLKDWTKAGLMMEDEGRVLSLAVFACDAEESLLGVEGAAHRMDGPSPGRSGPDRLWARSPRHPRTLRTVEMGSEVIVLDRARGRLLVLDAATAAIWKRCDGSRTVAAIADEFAGSGSSIPDPSPEGTARTIGFLLAEGLLTSDDASPHTGAVEC